MSSCSKNGSASTPFILCWLVMSACTQRFSIIAVYHDPGEILEMYKEEFTFMIYATRTLTGTKSDTNTSFQGL
ncbi:uncharacterized protein F5891DRAFT_1028835 [Suillus fuscotomentosus]|uniref:Secreted protein n=1 Tax=Suillus fuscotomentosus TaxID=1912939 RepID=A0AAD4E7X4_9AGAM|nr:uncharacterized protein F5891DRAFT_1028835 [Suillus fuscotomentosus]KAG1901314.1 hypothetical protein F5891DRAFT_1028835 [Suillus fuscotomentosus]